MNIRTAVYCFDIWISFLRKSGIKVAFQCHDEILFNLDKKDKETIKSKIEAALKKTNDFLKLNIKVDCESKFGETYASCH